MKKSGFLLAAGIASCALCAFISAGCAVNPSESSDATLKSITVSAGSLSPSFDKDKTSYSLVLPADASSVTVTGTANDAAATVSNPAAVDNLATGESKIVSIRVTAQNGSEKTYSITVSRDAAGNPGAPSDSLGYAADRVFGGASGRLFLTSGDVLAEIVDGKASVLRKFDAKISCADCEGSDKILLAVGSNVVRYDLAARTASTFYTTPTAIARFVIMGDIVIVDTASERRTVRLSTGVAYPSVSFSFDRPSDITAVANARSRAFWLTDTVIPVDIKYQDLNATTGVLSAIGESDYHGGIDAYPVLVSSPDGTRLFQGDGSVFTTDDVVERVAKLPYRFIDAVFYDDSLFILTDDAQVIRLGAVAPYAFEALVGATTTKKPRALEVCGTTLYAFSDDATGVTRVKSWIGKDLGAPVAKPTTTVDANGSVLWLPARKAVSGFDGTLYYIGGTALGSLKNSDQAILKYFDQYVTDIALESIGSLLVSEGQRLWRYTISSGEFSLLCETSGDPIGSFVIAGNYAVCFTSKQYSTSSTAYSVSLTTGVIVSNKSLFYTYSNPAWSATAGVIFAATVGVTPKDLYAIPFTVSDGTIGSPIDSQSHGGYPFTGPYCLSSDDSVIFCADGNYFDGKTPSTAKMPYLGTIGAEYANKGMFITGGKMYLITNLGQLLRFNGTAPYASDKNIASITSVPQAPAFGYGYTWILSTDATNAWITYAKRIDASSL